VTKKPVRSGRRAGPARPIPGRAARYAPLLLDAAIVALTFVCFWPLTHFYFAQDDFVFLERASHGVAESMGGFFRAVPGQFRPLTKGLYFLVTWPLFGLHAAPFHVVSILLHAANAVLVGVLLRRLGISAVVSRAVAVCFALNAGFLEAVAWIACVQQLIGNLFLLLALIFGVDALHNTGWRPRAAALVAYTLALVSYEQTVAAPLVLLAWVASRHGARSALAAAWGPLRGFWILLAAYALFVLGARGLPDGGPYAMTIGSNVLDNLRTYTGIAFALWLVFPPFGLPAGFTVSHAVWIALVAYLAACRKYRDLAFGTVAFLLLLAPVLFTSNHTHSFHLYVPAIGAWFLVASALESVCAFLARRAERVVVPVLAAVVVVCAVGCIGTTRRNATATFSATVPLPRSFVLRRAVLAERIAHDLRVKTSTTGPLRRIVLIYPYPKFRANWLNVHAALGQGHALPLILDRPGLETVFVPPSTVPGDARRDEVFYYTELGRCFTPDEWEAEVRRRAERAPRPPVTSPDSTAADAPGDG
jgi:hypothetical protein